MSDTPRTGRPIRSVGFLLIPNFSLLTYSSAVEPLRAANQLAGRQLYRWWHASPHDKPALASSGAAFIPDFEFDSDPGDIDLLMVCAGGDPTRFNDKRTFAWLKRLAARGIIMGGTSGGPVILAKAGPLRGRRCTVHWEYLPGLQEAYPDLKLTRSLFEIDRDRITCSGGVAGLDLMVALIKQDHGYELGAAVSEWFLHTHVREGAGPQRMDLRFRLGIGDERLLRALKNMESQLEKPLSRERLAKVAGLSLRALERLFREHLGRGIHAHYLSLRLKRARQLLQETSLSMLEIAVATGFRSASQFSRAYGRAFGASPSSLRRQA
jgi:transcriptional regulator GlxA family with amidase domain